MYVIKDSLYGGIRLSDFEASVLDTPEMQRLRRVKQLAMTYLVYPGANHSRFEHSLGTLHVTSLICENLGLPPEQRQMLRLAALLHDVGHGAFSHESESILRRRYGKGHEELADERIRSGGIASMIEEAGMYPSEIVELIRGKGIGQVIASGIGSDRMDYLARDAHYTGVAYGVIDADRLIQTMALSEGGLTVEEDGMEAAESMLIARHLMFSAVYFHHTVRIAAGMLKKSIEIAIEEKALNASDLVLHDDYSLFNWLKQCGRSRELVSAIEGRRLFKRAYVLEARLLSERGKAMLASQEELGVVSMEIAKKARVPEDSLLIDVPAYHEGSLANVLSGGGKKDLSEESELVKALKRSEERKLSVIVACPKEKAKEVGREAERAFSTYLGSQTDK